MDKIQLQQKTQAQQGVVEKYWFENEHIGLVNTLFYRITIPLFPFDSGLSYERQPLTTEIVVEWLQLHLPDEDNLDNLQISSQQYKGAECSIYVGGAHNWCEILTLSFQKEQTNVYNIIGKLLIDFESEGVAQNETFSFQTTVIFQ